MSSGFVVWSSADWANKIGDVSGRIEQIVNDRDIMSSLAVPDEFIDPSALGMPLQGGAEYAY